MSFQKEDSPEWLRSFQAPISSVVSLSSPSKSSPDGSPLREEETSSSPPKSSKVHDAEKSSIKNSKSKPVNKQMKIDYVFTRKKKTDNAVNPEGDDDAEKVHEKEISAKHVEVHVLDDSVLTLSSDSEPSFFESSKKEEKMSQSEASEKEEDAILVGLDGPSSVKMDASQEHPKEQLKGGQAPKKEKHANGGLRSEDRDVDVEGVEEKASDNQIKPRVSSSRLPLLLSEKVSRTKALVECDGQSIDLSGDMGAVGRVVVSDTSSGTQEMYLDLKGTIYKTMIVPSKTFCVVSVGQSEAKIEAIMNDFVQLRPHSNVYESETMVEGTLEGFSFESEDELEKSSKPASQQMDQSEDAEGQTKTKAKGKTENGSGLAKKRGRSVKEKPQPAKKARKRSGATKKTKAKK